MKKFLFLLLTFLISKHLYTQVKEVDLEISIISCPDVISCDGSMFQIHYQLTNHGPEDLTSGDSFFLYGPHIAIDEAAELSDVILYAGESLEYTINLNDEDIVFLLDLTTEAAAEPPYTEGKQYQLMLDAYAFCEDGMHNDPDHSNNAATQDVYWCSDETSGIFPTHSTDRSALSVYPNPVTDLLSLTYELYKKSDCQLEIFDMDGRILITKSWKDLPAGAHSFSIDMDHLPGGVYYLRFRNDRQVSYGKMVKM